MGTGHRIRLGRQFGAFVIEVKRDVSRYGRIGPRGNRLRHAGDNDAKSAAQADLLWIDASYTKLALVVVGRRRSGEFGFEVVAAGGGGRGRDALSRCSDHAGQQHQATYAGQYLRQSYSAHCIPKIN